MLGRFVRRLLQRVATSNLGPELHPAASLDPGRPVPPTRTDARLTARPAAGSSLLRSLLQSPVQYLVPLTSIGTFITYMIMSTLKELFLARIDGHMGVVSGIRRSLCLKSGEGAYVTKLFTGLSLYTPPKITSLRHSSQLG